MSSPSTFVLRNKVVWILMVLMTVSGLHAQTTPTFPTWIGVTGTIQRQAGGNPGVFTVLANQDYYGLHLSVGIQVNGGAWQEYLMVYSGRVDTNSVWTFAVNPDFPDGATVKYYYRAWDNFHPGVALWDNNNGSNYSFVAAVPTATVMSGDLSVRGVLRLQPRGDLSMGSFTNGPQP